MATNENIRVVQLMDDNDNPVSPVVNVGSLYDKNGNKVDNLLSYKLAGTTQTIPEVKDLVKDVDDKLATAGHAIGDVVQNVIGPLDDTWLPCDGRVVDNSMSDKLYTTLNDTPDARILKPFNWAPFNDPITTLYGKYNWASTDDTIATIKSVDTLNGSSQMYSVKIIWWNKSNLAPDAGHEFVIETGFQGNINTVNIQSFNNRYFVSISQYYYSSTTSPHYLIAVYPSDFSKNVQTLSGAGSNGANNRNQIRLFGDRIQYVNGRVFAGICSYNSPSSSNYIFTWSIYEYQFNTDTWKLCKNDSFTVTNAMNGPYIVSDILYDSINDEYSFMYTTAIRVCCYVKFPSDFSSFITLSYSGTYPNNASGFMPPYYGYAVSNGVLHCVCLDTTTSPNIPHYYKFDVSSNIDNTQFKLMSNISLPQTFKYHISSVIPGTISCIDSFGNLFMSTIVDDTLVLNCLNVPCSITSSGLTTCQLNGDKYAIGTNMIDIHNSTIPYIPGSYIKVK